MVRLFCASFVLLCAFCVSLAAQHENVSGITAVATTEKISVDGHLTEAAWAAAVPAAGFRQHDPDEGQPATERTAIRILHDDKALYIGVECFDREPGKIVSRIVRRDANPNDGDAFTLYLDPHHDHLTGAAFGISAAGVQFDWIISNDTRMDDSWDAVWESAVSIDDTGWKAEMRIPFSQLRFPHSDEPTWGINASRFIHRKNETSWLELVARKDFGLASRMAHLRGINGVEPGHNVEVLPYVRASAEVGPADPGNPFNDGSRVLGGSGMDIKYGVSSNLTLDGTVNPDFGQVEVDPAVVNLSAFETFFQEKRPFFLEGSQIFSNFGHGGGIEGQTVVDPTFFYSRRIGRSPHGFASGDFVETPANATILGAGKLSGKIGQSWTVGLINAVTSREQARVMTAGVRSREDVEPLTNYVVGRVIREFSGRGAVGFLTTGVDRKLETTPLQDLIPQRAHTFGGDGFYFFDKNHVWGINGRMSGSWISGSAAAIERLQTAPARYFQRPDMKSKRFNPGARSLNGWAGGSTFAKTSGGWTASTSITANSPGFDTNDAGFQVFADEWGIASQIQWQQLKPDRFSRQRAIQFNKTNTWNFDGQRNDFSGWGVDGRITFPNYWFLFGNFVVGQAAQDNRLTRGGPSALSPLGYNYFMGIFSDGRKPVTVGFSGAYNWNTSGTRNTNGNLDIGLKPSSSMTLSIGPSFSRSYAVAQYIDSYKDPTSSQMYGSRYVFGDLDQSSFGITSRVNLSLTPRMSLQVFSQTLLSSGRYWGFKELAKPQTFDFRRFGRDFGTIMRSNSDFIVDADGAGTAPSFTFSDPDFNFKSLRLNSVFRWEWKRGSTIYLVWTQSRQDAQYPGAISASRDLRALFGSPANNVFMIKTSYWFNK